MSDFYSATNATRATQHFSTNHKASSEQKNHYTVIRYLGLDIIFSTSKILSLLRFCHYCGFRTTYMYDCLSGNVTKETFV